MEKFQSQFRQIGDWVARAQHIVITTHKSPDGDAMGSMLGLAQVLSSKGKNVTTISVNTFADFLAWMPGSGDILINDLQSSEVASKMDSADLIFALDYNALSRVEQVGPLIGKASGKKVMIDHHLHPEGFADIQVSDPSYGSTAEMVYDFLMTAYGSEVITKEVAGCLYAGLVTDTGSFRFPSTRPESHAMAAHLLSTGLKHDEIHEAVYDTYRYERMRLIGYVLTEKMRYLPQLHTVIMVLTAKELESFHYKKGDTEGLVNMGLSISGVRFSCLISESEGVVKMSLRSKGDMPVNELASAHFNGGGHHNAAGGRSDLSPDATASQLVEILEKSYQRFLK